LNEKIIAIGSATTLVIAVVMEPTVLLGIITSSCLVPADIVYSVFMISPWFASSSFFKLDHLREPDRISADQVSRGPLFCQLTEARVDSLNHALAVELPP